MPMPELPVEVDDLAHDTQRDGTRDHLPVFQTHRGKRPEGHEDTMKEPLRPQGWARYEE